MQHVVAPLDRVDLGLRQHNRDFIDQRRQGRFAALGTGLFGVGEAEGFGCIN